MADLLSLSEAAKLLKITEDELRTLAQESKINGVRSDDGFSFKEAELQRYADEQGITLGDDASVLVEEGGAGAIITGDGVTADSDLKLADAIDDDLELMDGVDQSMELDLSGELDLLDDESEDDGEQDPNENTKFSLGDGNLDLDDLSLDLADDAEDLDPNENTVFGGELDLNADELSLEFDDADQNEKTVFGGALPEGDALDLVPDDELAIDLDDADENEDTQFAIGADGFQIDDDELVIGDDADLAGGTGGSDVALAGDSGINLGSPTDSGISLEDGAVDLVGGSSPSLELPEDISDIQQDDEFMLAPSDELSEESDSGSQVIALSDSVQFGDPAAIGGDVQADPFGGGTPADPFAGGAPADPGVAPAPLGPAIGGLDSNMGGIEPAPADPFAQMGPGPDDLQVPAPVMPGAPADTATDPPYTYFNVIGLLVIIIIQALVAVMMVELISNIWGIYRDTWQPGTNTSIGRPILDMFKDLVNNENWLSILGGVMGGFFLVLIIGGIVDRKSAKKQSAAELPPTLG